MRKAHTLFFGAICCVGFSTGGFASEPCSGPTAIETGMLDGKKTVVLGEVHGTEQGPVYFCALVRALLSKHPHLLVALEMPDETQPMIDSLLASDAAAADVEALLATPFWRREAQDGRTSGAILALLVSLAHLKRQFPTLSVVALDHTPDAGTKIDRDAVMARTLQKKLGESPGDMIAAVLIGNFHNRRRTLSDTEWQPNFLSNLGEGDIFSLSVATAGGTAWICGEDGQCKPTPRAADRDAYAVAPGTIEVLPPGAGHYDGRFFIGTISASSPAAK
jgi:hypothetical protein